MTEFQDGTLITMEVMGCQMHAIGKVIRTLFSDPCTCNTDFLCRNFTVRHVVVVMLLRDHPLFSAFLQEYKEHARRERVKFTCTYAFYNY